VSSSDEDDRTRTAVLRIARPKSPYMDRWRRYRVHLDGAEIGSIKNDEVREFAIEPGEHDVRLIIAWEGSDVLRFSVGPRETAYFIVMPHTALPVVGAPGHSLPPVPRITLVPA
jgi:hypothetical protein